MRPLSRTVCAALAGMTLAATSVAAQVSITISGTVQTEEGAPIPGATVLVLGLPFSAQSRVDGSYRLQLPATRITPGQALTLQARAINYKPRQATVTAEGAELTQDFVLPVNPLDLGEIVVTGAGTGVNVPAMG